MSASTLPASAPIVCGWLRLDKGGNSIRATRWLSEARLIVGDLKLTALFIAPVDKAPGDGLNAGCLRLDEPTRPRRPTRRSASKAARYASSRGRGSQMSIRSGSPTLQNHTLGRVSAAKLFRMKPWWKLSPVQISVWMP